MRPLIGISGNEEGAAKGRSGLYIGADYTDGIYAAGGLSSVVAFTMEEDIIRELADRLDGLLLTGGVDVDPRYFGQEPHIGLGEISPVRDAMEAKLLQAMLERHKPVLGICRGVQVMNAVLGGTLYQDLPREWSGRLQHAQQAPRQHMAHVVDLVANTRLAAIYGDEVVPVNTFHHQAVDQVAPGFAACAHSRDGLIEAIERPGADFVLGVQWHPENLWRTHAGHRRLFDAFVQAARTRAQA
ncbi:MAG: gamma-glutamyl-gamma-aminobutyrate hydrolase family protein [Firmicutes bacterium]|nr:gamma-glutamyl-gamma-aminobutyrate hydrolase family protein [Bacillota bacterium]